MSKPYIVRFKRYSEGPTHTGNAYATRQEADRIADILRFMGCDRAWVAYEGQMPEPAVTEEP